MGGSASVDKAMDDLLKKEIDEITKDGVVPTPEPVVEIPPAPPQSAGIDTGT